MTAVKALRILAGIMVRVRVRVSCAKFAAAPQYLGLANDPLGLAKHPLGLGLGLGLLIFGK